MDLGFEHQWLPTFKMIKKILQKDTRTPIVLPERLIKPKSNQALMLSVNWDKI